MAAQDHRNPNVLFIDAAPHDWLFPQVALAVHHGGAGTTAATIRAGIPSVIVPFFGDQPFWAWRLKQNGVAPAALMRKTLTAEQLAAAITAASADEMQTAAALLASKIAQEDGVKTAIATLEEWGVLEKFTGTTAPATKNTHTDTLVTPF